MEYVYMILFMAFLLALLVLLSRLDRRTKNKHKQMAYRLLETSGPDPKEVKNIIKLLRLYGGRWRKDKECIELVQRLQEKL
jgi:hypothetical protein